MKPEVKQQLESTLSNRPGLTDERFSSENLAASDRNQEARPVDLLDNTSKSLLPDWLPRLNISRFSERRNVLILLGVLAAIAVGGSALWYSQNGKASAASSQGQSSAAVVTVSVAPARVQPVHDLLTVTGSVSAWDPLSVGSEVSGLRITTVNVEEGDYVKKGQILSTLNSAVLDAQLSQAQARLASSKADFKKAVQPNRAEDIRALEAALAQAQATITQEESNKKQAQVSLMNAESYARRFRRLATDGAVSKQDAEDKEVAKETARAQVAASEAKIDAAQSAARQAHEKLLLAQRGGRLEDIQVSRAKVEETTAQIKQLQEQIAQTVIRAPDDGQISNRDAHIGDIVSAGKPLFSIIRLNRLEFRAQVSDIDLAKFKPGQTVNIFTTENASQATTQGKVWLVSPQVDATSRLGTVRIRLPNDSKLHPGMFVRGEVSLGERQSITVPTESVVTRNGESFVFSLDGDRAVSKPVKLGTQTDKFVEITDGLEKGQTVIAKGARFLNSGDIVRVSK